MASHVPGHSGNERRSEIPDETRPHRAWTRTCGRRVKRWEERRRARGGSPHLRHTLWHPRPTQCV